MRPLKETGIRFAKAAQARAEATGCTLEESYSAMSRSGWKFDDGDPTTAMDTGPISKKSVSPNDLLAKLMAALAMDDDADDASAAAKRFSLAERYMKRLRKLSSAEDQLIRSAMKRMDDDDVQAMAKIVGVDSGENDAGKGSAVYVPKKPSGKPPVAGIAPSDPEGAGRLTGKP